MAVVLTSNRTSVTQVAGLWSFSETISFTVAYRYASPTPISPSSLATLAGLSCIPTRNDFLFWSRDAFPTQSVVHDVALVSPLLTGSGESCPEHLPVWIVLPGGGSSTLVVRREDPSWIPLGTLLITIFYSNAASRSVPFRISPESSSPRNVCMQVLAESPIHAQLRSTPSQPHASSAGMQAPK